MFSASKTAGVSSSSVNYIEEVFSTWLYTGTGATQTITNGIDLSTKGGLTWIKSRSDISDHALFNTANGVGKFVAVNSTATTITAATSLTAFNTTGFTLGADTTFGGVNASASKYASWTIRKQTKFLDIVTYTGTGANRTIAHNLGSVPGCIIVRKTSATGNWQFYHRGVNGGVNPQQYYMQLNSSVAQATGATTWNNTAPTSTVFSLGTNTDVNQNGASYTAYIFAHDDGGFGLTGTDNVISCGFYTGNGSATGPIITLGYEPQWLMIKNTTNTDNWQMMDNMRGIPVGSNDAALQPNLTDAETSTYNYVNPTATGFEIVSSNSEVNGTSNKYIYIAIRRGPMKVPTVGTSVFTPVARSGTGATSTVSNSITTDLIISMTRNTAGIDSGVWDRLRGVTKYLATTATAAESTSSDSVTALNNTDYVLGADTGTDRINRSSYTYANWSFGRAPSFFDEVCYTGTGSNTTIAHNLTVIPELMIVKGRSGATPWQVYSSALASTEYLVLNTTAAKATGATRWNSTRPTSTVFSLGTSSDVNTSAATYVAYLFATCVGVSKVGSYTGNGTTQTIDCGLTAGARFVLIKRTDSTGSWYAYDTARGMTTLTDPYSLLNSATAEVATLGSVTTVATGFALNSAILAAINTNAATFIFLAIA